MSTEVAERPVQTVDTAVVEAALVQGDLARLTSEQRLQHYLRVCNSTGLNPHTQPFAYIMLNGKLTLYALKGCTDQLRDIHNITLVGEPHTEIINGEVMVVTIRLKKGDREDVDKGAVSIKGLSGGELANAHMRCLTKAKRRATLSICGLGYLDESETGDIQMVGPGLPSVLDTNLADIEACETIDQFTAWKMKYMNVKSKLSSQDQNEIERAAMEKYTKITNLIAQEKPAPSQNGPPPEPPVVPPTTGESPEALEARLLAAIEAVKTLDDMKPIEREFQNSYTYLPPGATTRISYAGKAKKADLEKKPPVVFVT